VAELKKVLESKKVVLGTDETLKLLRQGKIKKVYITSNCEGNAKEDIERLCKVAEVECVELSQSNDEIGVICKKPFAVSVVGVSA
ncbi:MAG: ribosomal L7Ae/L30e/S12e/Gadd45 family protein, partial [Candidatus Woesearchaeota archaeon]